MGRKSSIPDEILQYRPCKCTRLRDDGNGVYRVYKYTATKLPNGEWSNDWGYLIGKIVANEGFFPNKRYQKELEASQAVADFLTLIKPHPVITLLYASKEPVYNHARILRDYLEMHLKE